MPFFLLSSKPAYLLSTVGRHGSEEVIRQYVKNQGMEKDYKQLQSQAVQIELL